MKTYKKIGLGAALILAILSFAAFKNTPKAFALTTADLKSPPASYKFLALNTVQATINGNKYNFVDGKTSDNHYSYSSSSTDFCQPGSVSDDDYGIKFDSDPSNANNTINGTITLGSPSGPNCIEIGPVTVKVATAGVSGAQFQYSGKNIISLDGKNTYEPFTSGLPANYQDRVYGLGTAPGSCGGADQNDGEGEIIIMGSAGGSTGKMYILTNQDKGFSAGDDAVKEFPALAGIITPGTCWDYLSLDVNKGGPQPAIPITVTGALGQGPVVTPPSGGPTGDGNAATPADTCELSSNGFSLAWLMCPLLLAGEEISNNLINAFENELSFNVSQGLGNKDSQTSVEKTWSLFKNIATAILVILMLLMVFSQAISAGPFDAYTVRKMLPRLVIVAIAIQLSWPLVSFIIDTFDDIGRGIANIMYFSFGGADALSLGHILNNANIGTATAATISWVGLVGTIGLGIAALPALLLLVVTTSAAIITAVITLVLRKIIIILLLMLAPIALLAYVLPGTQRYWKLWLDNLIKILAMFPLVVALVAAGRIFAFIVGTQDNTQFLNFIFICVGFFGPLFFLPKTFKWGGQLMSVTANGVASATNRFMGKESALGKGFQGYGERKQGEKAKAYNPLDPMWKRGLRRVQSGHAIPFSERSRRLTIASGNKWADERNDEASAYVGRTQEKALDGYNIYDIDDDGNYLQLSKNAAGQYLDAAGNITNKQGAQVLARGVTKEQATFKRATGVEAGKQALIDIAGNSGGSVTDKRAAQAAQKLLIDTHSEIEFQNAQIQGGANQGRRVNEVESWKGNITSSPPHYSTVNGSRPDFAPDLLESAEAAASRRLGRQVTYQTASAADRRQIDVEKSRIAIERLTPEQVGQVHYGFYDDIGKIGAEAAIDRTGAPILDPTTGMPMNISQMLANRLSDFKNSGTTIGVNAVGALRGGKQDHVDAALRAAGVTLDTL